MILGAVVLVWLTARWVIGSMDSNYHRSCSPSRRRDFSWNWIWVSVVAWYILSWQILHVAPSSSSVHAVTTLVYCSIYCRRRDYSANRFISRRSIKHYEPITGAIPCELRQFLSEFIDIISFSITLPILKWWSLLKASNSSTSARQVLSNCQAAIVSNDAVINCSLTKWWKIASRKKHQENPMRRQCWWWSFLWWWLWSE